MAMNKPHEEAGIVSIAEILIRLGSIVNTERDEVFAKKWGMEKLEEELKRTYTDLKLCKEELQRGTERNNRLRKDLELSEGRRANVRSALIFAQQEVRMILVPFHVKKPLSLMEKKAKKRLQVLIENMDVNISACQPVQDHCESSTGLKSH